MDVLTPVQRKRCMAAVRAKGTKPELLLCRLLDSLRYRYRLHDDGLPGRPDIVLPRRKKAIFVHGCFWHRHNCKSGRSFPATRPSFWGPKLKGNKQRDRLNICRLHSMGWQVLVVWECQLRKNTERVFTELLSFVRNRTADKLAVHD